MKPRIGQKRNDTNAQASVRFGCEVLSSSSDNRRMSKNKANQD